MLVVCHFTDTSIMTWDDPQTNRVAESTQWPLRVTGRRIPMITLVLCWELFQWLIHPPWLTEQMFLVISMCYCCILPLVIFENTSPGHLNILVAFSLAWSNVLQKVLKIQARNGMMQLVLHRSYRGILPQLVLDLKGTVLIDAGDNVTIYWLCGLGIIQHKS